MNNNYVLVSIQGHNVNNYLKWLVKEKINILKISILNHHELVVIINYQDYQLLSKYSKTYKITIIKKYGRLRVFDIIKNNFIIIICLIFSVFFLYFLSNIIFSIDIISNDQEMIALLSKELSNNDLQKYRLKKSYHELETIKENILKNNKDTIEWLEITTQGTKYIVKYVERKQVTKDSSYDYQSITASKDAIITEIHAYNGEKLKNVNDYVKKDTVVISGIIEQPNGTKLYSKAVGNIYGEVWYKVTIEYPYTYYEEKLTGNHKNVLSFNFLGHQIPLIAYNQYRQFKTNVKTLLSNQLSLFSITYEEQYELLITEDIYTPEEVISLATVKAQEKLLANNNKIIEVTDVAVLDKTDLGSKIKLNLFFTVIEDITKIIEITKEEIPKIDHKPNES